MAPPTRSVDPLELLRSRPFEEFALLELSVEPDGTSCSRGPACRRPAVVRDHSGRLGTPAIGLPVGEWEPIGLGAIQDLVQEAFGPVEFDRSTVALRASDLRRPGCPACEGARFGFPGDHGGGPEPAAMPMPQRRQTAPRRNDPCPCGSGRKYKLCCGR